MTDLEFWQQRMVQTLHDPVHKALLLNGGLKHADQGFALSKALVEGGLRPWNHAPDRLATGADRPVLGSTAEAPVNWRKAPILTHPLQQNTRLLVPLKSAPAGQGVKKSLADMTEELMRWWEEPEHNTPPTLGRSEWKQLDAVRHAQLGLWRRLPEWARAVGAEGLSPPADTRTPDHSIEAHLRMAASASFVSKMEAKVRSDPQQPWLFIFSVRGVQEYIGASRKARDLWTACMIFTELAWAAMEVIVRRYGPEAVLYPDLRENPLMDRWLLDNEHEDLVPDRIRAYGAATYAAPIPNTFVALLPRGGDGLPTLKDLAEDCEQAVKDRWASLAQAVAGHIEKQVGKGSWQTIWNRQMAASRAPATTWTALRWRRRMAGQGEWVPGLAALPGRSTPPPSLPRVLQERHAALSPWLPHQTWEHYEAARTVFWRMDTLTHKTFLSGERGFDYPLVHQKLKVAQTLRKLDTPPQALDEPGEKCSLTGIHEALHGAGAPGTMRSARAAARQFWNNERLDVGNEGKERLGGPGALKRLLVQANETNFSKRWGRRDDNVGVPFPSTSALAAGRFLVQLALAWDDAPALRGAVAAVLRAAEAADFKRDLSRHALPRLLALRDKHPDLDQFLRLDPQLFMPEVLQTHKARAGTEAKKARIQEMSGAVQHLRRVARAAGVCAQGTQIAVLAMDGDGINSLLLGEPETIHARWRDVLHPEVVQKIEQDWPHKAGLAATEWEGLLNQPRHMGPALHAAITSALAWLGHHAVGWVVEQEFGGRLVYTGGDDVLALLPADEVVDCAARLQQLASAPYVIDTQPDQIPWGWRKADQLPSPDGKQERTRFRVPIVPTNGTIDLSKYEAEPHAAEGGAPLGPFQWDPTHRLITLLGRAHGLSAGVAMGHFKTPLQSLLKAARAALNQGAKKRQDPLSGRTIKAALEIHRFTRGGAKYSACMGWELGGPRDRRSAPRVQSVVHAVSEAIRAGTLPSRLPYKLRDALSLAGALLFDLYEQPIEARGGIFEQRHTLLLGLVRRAAGLKPEAQTLADHLVALLEAGLDKASSLQGQDRDQAIVAPLLLARDLADMQEVEDGHD